MDNFIHRRKQMMVSRLIRLIPRCRLLCIWNDRPQLNFREYLP